MNEHCTVQAATEANVRGGW